MQSLRVLFLCNSRWWGGAEGYVYSVAQILSEHGHEVFLASPEDSRIFELATEAEGITEIAFDLGPKLSRRSAADFALRWPAYRARLLRSLEKWIRRYQIELVHFQFKKEQLIGSACAARLGMRVLWTEHGQLPRLMSSLVLPRFLYRRASRSADRIICVSRFVMENMRRHGISQSRLRLCYNGIDATGSRGLPDTMSLRKALGLEPAHLVVGSVSRLARGKGLDHLLDAIPLVVGDIPNAKFVIVGDGPERASLERHAQRSGLDPHVVFAGHRTDAAEIAHVFDLFVCPSLAEGMPYSVMEAMRAGVPIVASRVGGLPELVSDGESGRLVDAGDSMALATAIKSLLLDDSERSALGAAARRRIRESFNIDAMAGCTERVIEEVLHDG